MRTSIPVPEAKIRTTRPCVKCGKLFTLTNLRVQEALEGHHMLCGDCKKPPIQLEPQTVYDPRST